MNHPVLILGGYGNFGQRIAHALVKAHIPVIIAGRHQDAADKLARSIKQTYPDASIEISIFDIQTQLDVQLKKLTPLVVINTCGPFQTCDYSIPKICIANHVHYIDLADARDFVTDISILDSDAKANDVLVVSGASTVPGLSSAVLEHYKKEFSDIDSLIYGISPGQQAPRGLATTQAILTYLGKPLKPVPGSKTIRYGWQDLYRQDYPELGRRWMANCDIPDLDLFPERYAIKRIQFSAGMESSALHLGMWLLSWVIRMGIPINLVRHAQFLLNMSNYFNWMGTPHGGMHMLIEGKDQNGNPKTLKWFLIAKNGDGPQIPCVPAIVLAKKLIARAENERGAMPCVGMVGLGEYLEELKGFAIRVQTEQ
jgi:hypothetical protein